LPSLNILGIGGFSHDSAACLMQDGRVVAAAMEERFTRKKHQGGMPVQAVRWCLESAGLTAEDLHHLGFYMNWKKRMLRRLAYRTASFLHSPRYSLAYILYEFAHNADYLHGAYRLKGRNTQIHFLDHHSMHASSAFFASPFEEAALLSIDYIGEWTSTWLGVGEGNRIRTLQEIHYPQSLGVFYSALTDYLGFQRANDEYKVMGLASYGDPERYIGTFRKMVAIEPEGEYRLDLDYFKYQYVPGSRLGYVSDKFIAELGPPRCKGEPIEQRHKDVAAAGQRVLEEVALHLSRHLYELSGHKKKLCIAGGVGLNCSMNGKLLSDSPFEEIYVQPAAGDDGIALGAVYHLYYEKFGHPRSFGEVPPLPNPPPQRGEGITDSPSPGGRGLGGGGPEQDEITSSPSPCGRGLGGGGQAHKDHPQDGLPHVYLGPSYDDKAIENILKISKLNYRQLDNVARTTAEWIHRGAIVGWFQGAMEFGPRALGARSILADPTRAEMKDILNQWVKHREDFRPFAPTVCEENFHEFFVHPRPGPDGNGKVQSPFMLFVFPVREEARARIPAVTHVDGTARVQTLAREVNPLYYDLIREFETLSGVPVVLNTSFNIRGEPIVCSPQDALRCFFTTGIDVLVIGRFLVQK